MQPENLIPQPFRFSDHRQARIYEKLRLISPGVAPFYYDACRIMEAEPPFESTTHLVGHLIRELESSLRAALEPYKVRSEEQAQPKAKKKNKKAGEAEGHKDDIKALLKGLDIAEDDPVAEYWLGLAGSFHERAHRDNLEPPRQVNEEYRQFWSRMTDILYVVLDRLEARYLKSFRFLDDLLAKESPTIEDAKRLHLNVPNNPATYGYFFHRLRNPAWLKPLSAQKLFDHTLEPIYELTEKGKAVSYSPWPQSRCLARMAAVEDADVQQTVLEIALGIETENIFIRMDLVDVAKALPGMKAAELARKEARWIEKQRQLFHLMPEKLGELIAHLAAENEVDAALELTRTTLAVLPNPRAQEDKDSILRFHRDPVSRLEGWDYARVLSLSLPALVEAGGARALELFCDLLETAISFYQEDAAPDETDDYSDTWRRDIDHRGHDDVKDLLVSAVRKSVERLAGDDLGQVPTLVGILESRRWLIFKRLSLHLLRLAPEQAGDIITERITNRANFDERGLWHEYILLTRDYFNKLTEGQRGQVLGWIDEGPSPEDVRELDGVRLTDEEAEKGVKAAKLRRLSPLRDVLPDDWKRRYDEWAKDIEEPRDAEYTTPYSQERLSFPSLESSEVLSSKSVKEVVSFLGERQHSADDSSMQSPEALGVELASLVTANPGAFAKKAASFRQLHPIYVRAFLSGIHNAATQSKSFDWRPVLSLSRWALQQSKKALDLGAESTDQDKTWLEAKSTVSRLLRAGFKEGDAEIPFTLRSTAWKLLKPFTDDPQPTPEDEERQGTDRDFGTYAINTVRGEAMHTVMHYALWVQRHLKKEPDGEGRVARGFEEMPEVRKTLEHHLDPKHDPSLAVRSVYGQWLPNLITLDENWITKNLPKIFPADEASRDLLYAAWEAYIRSWGVYNNIFEVLREEYGRAIERIGEEKTSGRHSHTLDQRLAQHLMLAYSYGKLDLDDPEGLLAHFYAKAPDSLCGHALWYVGYSFHELKEEVHPAVLQRFQALWQKRLSVARSTPEAHVKEMTAFGNLFYSQKFDDAWAITELNKALEISKWAEPSLFVVQRLADLAGDYPETAIKCLSRMVEGAKEDWELSSWGLSIRTIITAARRSDEDTNRAAVELVHRLGARGHTEFLDLLSDNARENHNGVLEAARQ
jgi:hypothetical protein